MSILTDADEIINGERAKAYGSVKENFDTIAKFWSTWIQARHNTYITMDQYDVEQMMLLLKSARLASSPDHMDSRMDQAGYNGCIEKYHNEVKAINEAAVDDIPF